MQVAPRFARRGGRGQHLAAIGVPFNFCLTGIVNVMELPATAVRPASVMGSCFGVMPCQPRPPPLGLRCVAGSARPERQRPAGGRAGHRQRGPRRYLPGGGTPARLPSAARCRRIGLTVGAAESAAVWTAGHGAGARLWRLGAPALPVTRRCTARCPPSPLIMQHAVHGNCHECCTPPP